MIQSGVGVKQCQKLLRHASISTTLDIYSHLLDEDLEDSIEKMFKQVAFSVGFIYICVTPLLGLGTSAKRAHEFFGGFFYAQCSQKCTPTAQSLILSRFHKILNFNR